VIILQIILFLLGVVFLLLGWRWQNPSSEEVETTLKGLAYLKREILQVQDQVQVLEDKVQRTEQIELKKELSDEIKKEIKEEIKEELREELKETEDKEKNKLYELSDKDLSENKVRVEQQRTILPKYQEVLELAAHGQRIPEIAQKLLLSQDAVMMVLKTQSKGVTE
jgi:hypothetical protein